MNTDPCDTCKPGDPDPTPDSGPFCNDRDPNTEQGYVAPCCTRSRGHAGQHVVGTGVTVRDVWPNKENTMDTPTPATLPDGWHLTTFGAVRAIGRGDVSVAFATCYEAPSIATFLPWDDAAWRGRGGYGDKQPVIWREVPPKLIPVMLTASDAETLHCFLRMQATNEVAEGRLVSPEFVTVCAALRAALDGGA